MAGVDLSSLGMSGVLGSLNVNNLVNQLMAADQAPITQMKNQQTQIRQRESAMQAINISLTSLLSNIQTLNLRGTIDGRAVSTDTPSASSPLVTASATSDAANGSFMIRVIGLATATTVTSGTGPSAPSAIGNAVAANQPLASAGFGITPTSGTFTVNGAQIAIDANTVLSDGTDAVGANTVFAKIRDATASLSADKQVRVSWDTDENGRPNKLVLGAAGAIQLGSGSDTSNFLTATGLAALPPSTTMTSARNLGGVNAGQLLNSLAANIATPLSPATGSFAINGVTISYDASRDTLNSVINRINSSSANVTATYDPIGDTMTLTAKNTGATLIGLQDVSGNFLAAMGLAPANEKVGTNASYLLNGVQRYSTSNKVSDALPGVTLNLIKADANSDVTVTVSQDTSSAVAAIQNFVTQYNNAITLISKDTAYDSTTHQGSILSGDMAAEGIQSTLESLVSGSGDGLSSSIFSLADIGVTTGAVGSAPGTTKTLVVDTTKLTNALQNNPSAVADLFGGLAATSALGVGGTGSIASVTGTPSNHVSGTYNITSDAAGSLTGTFTPQGGPAFGLSVAPGDSQILANGINTRFIPGLTLTAKGALAAGSDSVTTIFTKRGVGVKLADYLASLTSSKGVFASERTSDDSQIKDLTDSINQLQQRLTQKQNALTTKFNGLEVALANLQSQNNALLSQLASLSAGGQG